MNLERRHYASDQRYTENLRVAGDYHTAKRNAQLEAARFLCGEDGPHEDRAMSHTKNDPKYALFEQLSFLANICWEEVDKSPLPKPTDRVAQLDLLLKLDHQLLGRKAVNLIRIGRAGWKLMCGEDGNSERQSGCCGGKLVKFKGKTFAEFLEEQRWIKIPDQCRRGRQHTMPAATPNIFENYPADENQTLVYFAKMFGFQSCEDFDEDGKTFMFHLFHAVSYCELAARIAKTFNNGIHEVLPGDFLRAMSQKVTGSTPHGWTALHVLCSGSDASGSKAAIIRHILETRLVSIQAFDRWTNNQVACFFCFGPHIPQGVGFHPPQGYEPQCICLHTSPPTLNSKGVYWHKYDMILQVE